MSSHLTVAVAGAAGHLGGLISLSLRRRGATVKALVRQGTSATRTKFLTDAGVIIEQVDFNNIETLTNTLRGTHTTVSALQGLRDVLIGVQGNLLQASVAAGVQRFIPSDFSLDFTKTSPGSNRNLDLRREFHTTLDNSGIPQWTSVLNGAFMEMLVEGQMPMIIDSWKRVVYFGSPDQKLEFTTVPDTAEFTAAVAVDTKPTPKVLRFAGDSVSAKDLAAIASKIRGSGYSPMWTGSIGFLRSVIWILKALIGGQNTKIFPPWQAMQYLENMASGAGKLDPIDNERYPEVKWTTIEKAMAAKADADSKKTA